MSAGAPTWWTDGVTSVWKRVADLQQHAAIDVDDARRSGLETRERLRRLAFALVKVLRSHGSDLHARTRREIQTLIADCDRLAGAPGDWS